MEDNTLVALTLMIAESKSGDKGMMINVILNLMQKDNESVRGDDPVTVTQSVQVTVPGADVVEAKGLGSV